ncbi:unnamed protein product, partial [marine sediment metagenome]
MKKVKIGLIGCGKIADYSHVPSFLEIAKKAEIIALYDLNAKAAQKLKKAYSLKAAVYTSVRDLLRSGIQGVVISTPNSSHCKLTIQALKSGVHVLVEKPMAVNLKEADMMIASAREKNLVLEVNQALRFLPNYVQVKEMMEAAVIGDPI